MLMSSPWRHPRTGVWYFRRSIPARLRPFLTDWGWEFKRTLDTADPAEAKRRWHIEAARCEALFEEAGVRLARANGEPLAAEEMQAAGRAWFRAKLDGSDATLHALVDLYINGTDPETGETHVSISKADVAEAFRGAKVDLKAAREVLAAEAIKALEAGHSMRDALEGWKREREARPSTVQEWGRVINSFGAERRVETITSKDVREFKDKEVARGLAKGTVAKYLTALGTVLGYAVENEWIVVNPASGIKVREGREKSKRIGWSAADLKVLFDGPIHACHEIPGFKTAGGEAAYWLPILALYTGARERELAQLRAEDVSREDGIAYLWITNEEEGQNTKGDTRRRVPLHPDIRAQFRAFAPQEGSLFPRMWEDSGIDRNVKAWSQWFGRYKRRLGIKDRRKVFHSLRHTFKDLCRDADVPKEVHDRLTGHTQGDAAWGYGEGGSLRLMAKHMGRIKVPVKVFGGA
jgi:integrase